MAVSVIIACVCSERMVEAYSMRATWGVYVCAVCEIWTYLLSGHVDYPDISGQIRQYLDISRYIHCEPVQVGFYHINFSNKIYLSFTEFDPDII